MNNRLKSKTVKGLFSLPNVVGVGYGLQETAGRLTGQKGIIVLVSKKVPETHLAQDQVVPKVIEGKVSDVIEVGKIVARGGNVRESRKSLWRPAPGGVSIGHYKITAGTLGAVVYDKCWGNRLILSNNHVLANGTNGKDRRAKIGDPILQPGPLDGGTIKCDMIGRLYRYVPLRDKGFNIVDSAIAKPLKPSLVTPHILSIGRVKGTASPQLGMEVRKSGRTTGLTYGIIRAVNVSVKVDYDGRVLKFIDQILVNNFDKPGDSGSLVVNNTNHAVGLLFAESDEFTFLNPIRPVLKRLRVCFK